MPAAALPFIIGGIGAAGSVASGIIGSNAAGHAADTQAAAADNAARLQKQAADEALAFNKLQYGNSLNLLSPWVNTGQSAIQRLSQLMGLRPNVGLPPGVINPNAMTAPQTQVGGGGVGGSNFGNPDVIPALAGGGAQINRFRDVNGAQLDTGNMPAGFTPQGGTVPGQNFGTNGIVSPNDPTTGAAPGSNFGINPGGGVSPNDPGAFPGNPDANNFNAGGTVNASTNVGGTRQVPQTGNTSTGDPADFGSLAQGFNEQFQAPTDVTEVNDPGYQFRLKQGQDALERSAAARGGLLTGGTGKALSDYNQNAASAEYGNVYGRAASEYERRYNIFKQNQNDLFNRLSVLSGGGQTTAGQLNSAGLSSASNAGNILLTSAGQIGNQLNNAAAARGSGYVGSANAINGAITGGLNGISTIALLKAMQGDG